MHLLKVVKIGDELGVFIPADLLASLKVKEGDNLLLTGGQNTYKLRAPSPTTLRALPLVSRAMDKYGSALKSLEEEDTKQAKSTSAERKVSPWQGKCP